MGFTRVISPYLWGVMTTPFINWWRERDETAIESYSFRIWLEASMLPGSAGILREQICRFPASCKRWVVYYNISTPIGSAPYLGTWMFPKIVGFPPKSSILIGFSIMFTIHFWFFPLFLETPKYCLLGMKKYSLPPTKFEHLQFTWKILGFIPFIPKVIGRSSQDL